MQLSKACHYLDFCRLVLAVLGLLDYHSNLVIAIVRKPEVSIAISINESNYCSWSWQIILMQHARSLIKFAHLGGIGHTKPYIIVNINPYSIGPRGRRCSIVFFEFFRFWVKAPYLCRIVLSEPQISLAVYCYSPSSAVIRWRGVLCYFSSLRVYLAYFVAG